MHLGREESTILENHVVDAFAVCFGGGTELLHRRVKPIIMFFFKF